MSEQEIPKLYHSIGQVSRMTGVEQHVLRFWETEFKDLAPRKNRAGRRVYSRKDVETVLRIKELLYDERYTIEGARRKLREKGRKVTPDDAKETYRKTCDRLREIRQGLVELKELLLK